VSRFAGSAIRGLLKQAAGEQIYRKCYGSYQFFTIIHSTSTLFAQKPLLYRKLASTTPFFALFVQSPHLWMLVKQGVPLTKQMISGTFVWFSFGGE
jgi:hypothetical protein